MLKRSATSRGACGNGARTVAPRSVAVRACQPSSTGSQQPEEELHNSRRDMLRAALALTAAPAMAGLVATPAAEAISGSPLEYKKELARRRRKVPESEYKDGPQGLKIYDVEVGGGQEAKVGDRVAIHFDCKFRGVTFVTSRQGAGVTGGVPFGFDVGQPAGEAGGTLPGIDLGVRGMRVGGQRKLIVPPGLAYGPKGIGEIPPNATLQIDIELLSIKTSPFGSRVKLVEG